MTVDGFYQHDDDGIWKPQDPVIHRSEEYDEAGFDGLLRMQTQHFWYQGRHRFLLAALRRRLQQMSPPAEGFHGIDLGGGCGGWIQYLSGKEPSLFSELALADSSLKALSLARAHMATDCSCYQVDLLKLGWKNRWDIAFMLDVLEHIPQHVEVLQQIRTALKPGGLLFVAVPALRFFWSYNDELAGHQRRYSRRDFGSLAERSGLQLIESRYFMFFLSPMLFLSRLRRPRLDRMSNDEVQRHLSHTHRTPLAPINKALAAIFSAETPIGLWTPFPWGTSVLAVMSKPG